MNNFTKKITLDFEASKSSLKKVKEETATIAKDFSKGFSDKLSSDFSSSKTGQLLSSLPKNAADFGALGATVLMKGADYLVEKVGEVFSKAWEELDEVLSYSKLTDSSVRETKLTYGLSSADAYAMDKALDIIGVDSLEDLEIFGTQAEKEKFFSMFESFSNSYNNLFDSGFFEEMQEFEWARSQYELEMEMSVMKFFTDNKDIILWFMDTTVSAVKKIATSLSIITGNRDTSRLQSKNITVNSTYNVTQEKSSWISDAGRTTANTIIKALEG